MVDPAKSEAAWSQLEAALYAFDAELADLDYPFGGNQPLYADFVLVSSFIWLEKAGPSGAWDMIKSWKREGSGPNRWERLYLNCEKYMQIL